MDLANPLKQGLWVGFGSKEVFITILYESLPVFCFKCGLVGHAVSSCPDLDRSPNLSEGQPSASVPAEQLVADASMLVDGVIEPPPSSKASAGLLSPGVCSDPLSAGDETFGPWMVVQHRRKRGGAATASGPPRSGHPPQGQGDTWQLDPVHARHASGLRAPRGSFSRGGRAGRGFSSSDFPPFRGNSRSGPPVNQNLNHYPEASGVIPDCFEKEHDFFAPTPSINCSGPRPDLTLPKGKAAISSPLFPSPTPSSMPLSSKTTFSPIPLAQTPVSPLLRRM